jgi:hypothetical protein
MVGKRHHIVPHFHLSRFGNNRDQLLVRDRITGRSSVRSAGDMAVRDFNTYIDLAGDRNSSFETIFGEIESATAEVLRQHIDVAAFTHPRAFTEHERRRIDTYVSTQHSRGMRSRRMTELLADFSTKLLNQGRLSPDEMEQTEFVPHQNDHLRTSAALSERVFEHLGSRPLQLVFLDRPLLLIGDEPVLVFGPGLAGATEIILPVSPSVLLVYGSAGSALGLKPLRVSGRNATDVGREVNEMTVRSAITWVAASPKHATLRTMTWPKPEPILRVSDGGSPLGEQLNSAPHRPPRRLKL